ncbi:Fpg/Nei family DNA glycosylase [Vallicoccus soli]|uniref:DNA-(apurinic or apyrimidinic site) lyase n=1 Tax=Vallicoccus soli TaxID=2339232 RepID=A0A3A3ZLN1_9ACTN|nr:DNA-formamidopyrimidine glycosylase family protein [Vallicoccus soli]RJK97102.1 Fpg/Nei family DNA glycosylase [Vallicoccus soli]
MPEGHTIHRLARDLGAAFQGEQVAASTLMDRFADGARLLDGQVVERLDAHGKHLFVRFGPEAWLHVHLGLYGKFTVGRLPAPEAKGALRLRLVGREHWADLRGPTACEVVTPAEKARFHARLGPDPLRKDADPDRAWDRISRSRVAVGALLMQQEVVAGIGNVYRAEILYRHGIEPHREGRGVHREEWDASWDDLRTLMRAGVRAGRIVTTRPEHRSRRSGRATREDSFYVYRRTGLPCRLCGTPVLTEVMAARNLYWCPVCQPR